MVTEGHEPNVFVFNIGAGNKGVIVFFVFVFSRIIAADGLHSLASEGDKSCSFAAVDNFVNVKDAVGEAGLKLNVEGGGENISHKDYKKCKEEEGGYKTGGDKHSCKKHKSGKNNG